MVKTDDGIIIDPTKVILNNQMKDLSNLFEIKKSRIYPWLPQYQTQENKRRTNWTYPTTPYWKHPNWIRAVRWEGQSKGQDINLTTTIVNTKHIGPDHDG
jgi:hypothetical protein